MRAFLARGIIMSSSNMKPLKDAKQALRQTNKTRLSALSDEDIARQSQAAQKALLALPQYYHAQRVGIYLSMPTGEARTEILVRDALDRGKVVFVPYIYKTASKDSSSGSAMAKGKAGRRSVMEMLQLRSLAEWEALKRDSWGIPSLDPETLGERENAEGGQGLLWKDRAKEEGGSDHGVDVNGGGLDLIVVPGVAFDHGMNRLGHGAGFYDSYLSRLCGSDGGRKPFLIGLCLAEQLISGSQSIPVTDHDWRVDAVAVGDGEVVTSANA